MYQAFCFQGECPGWRVPGGGGGGRCVLPVMAYTGRPCLKGKGFHKLSYMEGVWKSVILNCN